MKYYVLIGAYNGKPKTARADFFFLRQKNKIYYNNVCDSLTGTRVASRRRSRGTSRAAREVIHKHPDPDSEGLLQ